MSIKANRKKYKLLRKNAIMSNFNRIINNTIILELVISLLSLTNEFLILTTFLMSSLITSLSTKVILSIIMCLNTYLISVGGAIVINNLYNKTRLRKFSSREKQELLEEELLSKIELEKITVRKKLDDIAKEFEQIARININSNIDLSKLDGLYKELDYLIEKKNLIENHLNLDDDNLFSKKITKKIDIFNRFVFAPYCAVFLELIGTIPLFGSIFVGAAMGAIMQIITEEAIYPKIVRASNERLVSATTNVENKLGDFYLPKEQDRLFETLDDTRSKIVIKMNEISTYYYDLYVNKLVELSNNKTTTKSIAPIDRTYDPISHYRRIRKEDSK